MLWHLIVMLAEGFYTSPSCSCLIWIRLFWLLVDAMNKYLKTYINALVYCFTSPECFSLRTEHQSIQHIRPKWQSKLVAMWVCIGVIGLDKDLSLDRCQAIVLTNDDLFTSAPLHSRVVPCIERQGRLCRGPPVLLFVNLIHRKVKFETMC